MAAVILSQTSNCIVIYETHFINVLKDYKYENRLETCGTACAASDWIDHYGCRWRCHDTNVKRKAQSAILNVEF